MNLNPTHTPSIPTPPRVDLPRLRADLRALAARSRTLKQRLAWTWTEPMADVQRELVAVRLRTTHLLVLLAWTRGRLHLRTRPRSGSVSGTPMVYVALPGTSLTRCIDWTPEAHRDLIVAALAPEYSC